MNTGMPDSTCKGKCAAYKLYLYFKTNCNWNVSNISGACIAVDSCNKPCHPSLPFRCSVAMEKQGEAERPLINSSQLEWLHFGVGLELRIGQWRHKMHKSHPVDDSGRWTGSTGNLRSALHNFPSLSCVLVGIHGNRSNARGSFLQRTVRLPHGTPSCHFRTGMGRAKVGSLAS